MKAFSHRSLLLLLAALLAVIGVFELHLLLSISDSEQDITVNTFHEILEFKQLKLPLSDHHTSSELEEPNVSASYQDQVIHSEEQSINQSTNQPPLPESAVQSTIQSTPSNDESFPGAAFIHAFATTNPWSTGDVLNRCHEIAPFISQSINQSDQPQKLRIIVLHSSFERSTTEASRGASMGELTYWKEVLFALCLIDAERTFITVENDMLKAIERDADALKTRSERTFDIIVTDIYSIVSLQQSSVFTDWIAVIGNKCRLRILDDWGTPSQQNHVRLHLQQYWVPWSCASNAADDITAISKQPPLSINGNYLLGHFVLPARSAKPIKKLQGMVWGKEPAYFSSVKIVNLLEAIASILPIIMTARPMAEGHLQHSNITNLGIVSQAERERLLDESLFLIGVGDPVVGLTPFEAMSHGVVYLNSLYSQGKFFWMNPTCEYASQHPATIRLEPPYVHQYPLHAIQSPEMIAEVKRIVQTIIANFQANDHIQPFIDPFLTLAQFAKRLNDSLHDPQICSEI